MVIIWEMCIFEAFFVKGTSVTAGGHFRYRRKVRPLPVTYCSILGKIVMRKSFFISFDSLYTWVAHIFFVEFYHCITHRVFDKCTTKSKPLSTSGTSVTRTFSCCNSIRSQSVMFIVHPYRALGGTHMLHQYWLKSLYRLKDRDIRKK